MSTRVLVVLEDPTYDQYIVKPLVERMLSRLGKPKARVDVLKDPWMKGVTHVLKWDNWKTILAKYASTDCFVIVVDSDCEEGRDVRLTNLVGKIADEGGRAAAVLAIEEVEVWLLAGYTNKLRASWKTIRKECHPKEKYFDPFLESNGTRGVGGGRLALMRDAASNLKGLKERCSEIRELCNQLRRCLH